MTMANGPGTDGTERGDLKVPHFGGGSPQRLLRNGYPVIESSWELVRDTVLPYGPLGYTGVVHARAFEPAPGSPPAPPVVIIGQFGDHDGPDVKVSITEAAAAVQAALYPDGRPLRFVQHRTFGPLSRQVSCPEFEEVVFAHRDRLGTVRRWRARRAHHRAGRHLVAVTLVSPDGASRCVVPAAGHVELPWRFRGPRWATAVFELQWPAPQSGGPLRDLFGLRDKQLVRAFTVGIPDLLGDLAVQVWPTELYLPGLVGGPAAARLAGQRNTAARERIEAMGRFIDAYTTNDDPDTFIELHNVPNPNRHDLDC